MVGSGVCVVSVVIPTYNRADLVGRAIKGVLTQTFSDFELIVVDDGSTDHTVEVVERFQDPRVRLLRLPENRGVSRARNEGIRVSRGELVAFLDHDDEWLPRKLELQVACLRANNDPWTTVVYCRGRREIDGTTKSSRQRARPLREGEVFDHLLAGWMPGTSQFVVKRSVLVDIGGFDEELAGSEHWDLWPRLAQAANKFAAVDEVLVIKHEGYLGSKLSTDPDVRRRDFEILNRKWGPTIGRRFGVEPYHRWKAARYANIQYAHFMRMKRVLADGSRRAAWKDCLAMCRYVPWSRRFLIHGLALVLLGPRAYGALAGVEGGLVGRRGSAQ
jgi:glycosyltransferase involved in cell wall biosynthesis